MIHISQFHDWNVTPGEAVEIQKTMAEKVILHDVFDEIRYIAGIDVGFENKGNVTRAAVCVLELGTLRPVEQVIARRPTEFPYVPGLLSFREVPAILDAMKEIRNIPQLLMCDGQGYAHPRRLGIATHLGILTDLPSIGVGKSRLIGRHGNVPDERGNWTPLMHKEEIVGAVLRTRENVNPLYISAGHKISLDTAIGFVMRCVTRYKLPEPTRLADRLASQKSPANLL